MAKRSKAKNNRINQSQTDKNAQVEKFMNTKNAKTPAPSSNKSEEKVVKNTEQQDQVLSERERAVKEQEDSLNKLKAELDKQAREQQAEQEKLEKLRADAKSGFEQERKTALTQQNKELSALEKEHSERIKNDLAAQKNKERELLDLERSLDEREANAKAGFVDQEKEAIREYQDRKSEAKSELDAINNDIEEQVNSHSNWLEARQHEFDDKFRAEQRRLNEGVAQLQHDRDLLSREEQKLKTLKDSQSKFESKIRSDIESEYLGKIKNLEVLLEQEKKGRQLDQDKLTEQDREMIEFRDFKRQMDDANPQAVQDELNRRMEEIKALKVSLSAAGSEELSDKCDALEGQVVDQQERISQLMQDLEQANTEVHRIRLSVAAKHNLETEKKVLEIHNKTLETAINQLRDQLEELVEKQQGSKVFPALSALDQKHRQHAANLQIVPNLKELCTQIRLGLACVNEDSPLYYREEDVRIFLAGLSMSNLHILQGMSGTGKTSLAIAFAKVMGGICTNIAVQAGWRDKDDLLGHYNAFEKKFYEREALQALYKAQLPEYEDRLNIILLDEVNLSRPEQYFAELLSALELKASERSIVLVEEEQHNAPNELVQGRKIKVPDNVWFIGTANHDETTNEFADKTYDRSHVMELMRNEGSFSTDEYEYGNTYSYDSLRNAFKEACNKHKAALGKLLKNLNNSHLAMCLEDSFEVSWGNRLERHALRFIPVMVEAGGSIGEALDHLLATKVFRRGKVTGRFDISLREINDIEEALIDTWDDLGLDGKPEQCLSLLSKDRQRLERGA